VTQAQDHPNINRNIHPPILLLIHVLAAFLLNWLFPLPFAFSKILEWMGYILVFIGLGFAFSAVSQFGKMRTTLDPHGSVSTIVTSGPYRFSRNPIYLGFVCTLIGLPLALGNVWGVALSPVLMALLYQLVIKHEEAYLEEKFKDVYTSYKSRVRRWL
jgi:protein-S-isoprenylcysteine O-methyltransferase Ste14